MHATSARFILVALCCALVRCGGGDKSQRRVVIQVKGSDTMVNLAQAWAERYAQIDSTVEIEVSGGGSGVGIAALIKGTIDIANASRNIKPAEIEQVCQNTGKGPVEFIVGYDALAVFVHPDNPIDHISMEQLAHIFGQQDVVERWDELGVTIAGARTSRIIRISRQSSSGTYEFFRSKVLNKKDFRLGSCDMNGSKEVVELVGNTKTAIGYSGMGYATRAVRMLTVAVSDSTEPIEPSVENAQSKRYPLARSLLVYTLGEPEGALKRYLEWIMSDEGQKIVEETGYVPIAPKYRTGYTVTDSVKAGT